MAIFFFFFFFFITSPSYICKFFQEIDDCDVVIKGGVIDMIESAGIETITAH